MHRSVLRKILRISLAGLVTGFMLPGPTLAADPEVLKPRVPADQIDEARSWVNPFPASQENIEKGKAIFHGKGFCVTCHARDGSEGTAMAKFVPTVFSEEEAWHVILYVRSFGK